MSSVSRNYKMAFAQFDQLIISNIFSYLGITEIIPTKEAMEKARKFPKCARKEFVDSLHPYYLLIWRLKDHYNGCSFFKDNFIYNALIKKVPNEYVFYLIEKVKFKATINDLEVIYKSENLEIMKYYQKIGFITTINQLYLVYLIERGRLDIIEWLFATFEKHIEHYKKYLLHKSVQENKTEIADFLHKKGIRMNRGNVFVFRECLYSIEWRLRNSLISAEMLAWLWKNDYRWTRKDADAFGNEEMKKYF